MEIRTMHIQDVRSFKAMNMVNELSCGVIFDRSFII